MWKEWFLRYKGKKCSILDSFAYIKDDLKIKLTNVQFHSFPILGICYFIKIHNSIYCFHYLSNFKVKNGSLNMHLHFFNDCSMFPSIKLWYWRTSDVTYKLPNNITDIQILRFMGVYILSFVTKDLHILSRNQITLKNLSWSGEPQKYLGMMLYN